MILIETEDTLLPDPLSYGFATPDSLRRRRARLDRRRDPLGVSAAAADHPGPRAARPGDARAGGAQSRLAAPRRAARPGPVHPRQRRQHARRPTSPAIRRSPAGCCSPTRRRALPRPPSSSRTIRFAADIPDLVAAGYVVRTRADADTVEARSGDTGPRDAAIASGAQWVSTDYPVENPDFGTGYVVADPRRRAGALQPDQRPGRLSRRGIGAAAVSPEAPRSPRVGPLATLASLAVSGCQRGVRMTTGMSRVVRAW